MDGDEKEPFSPRSLFPNTPFYGSPNLGTLSFDLTGAIETEISIEEVPQSPLRPLSPFLPSSPPLGLNSLQSQQTIPASISDPASLAKAKMWRIVIRRTGYERIEITHESPAGRAGYFSYKKFFVSTTSHVEEILLQFHDEYGGQLIYAPTQREVAEALGIRLWEVSNVLSDFNDNVEKYRRELSSVARQDFSDEKIFKVLTRILKRRFHKRLDINRVVTQNLHRAIAYLINKKGYHNKFFVEEVYEDLSDLHSIYNFPQFKSAIHNFFNQRLTSLDKYRKSNRQRFKLYKATSSTRYQSRSTLTAPADLPAPIPNLPSPRSSLGLPPQLHSPALNSMSNAATSSSSSPSRVFPTLPVSFSPPRSPRPIPGLPFPAGSPFGLPSSSPHTPSGAFGSPLDEWGFPPAPISSQVTTNSMSSSTTFSFSNASSSSSSHGFGALPSFPPRPRSPSPLPVHVPLTLPTPAPGPLAFPSGWWNGQTSGSMSSSTTTSFVHDSRDDFIDPIDPFGDYGSYNPNNPYHRYHPSMAITAPITPITRITVITPVKKAELHACKN